MDVHALTVMVFRKNTAARTFQVPFSWLHIASVTGGLLILALAVSITLHLRTFFSEKELQPTRMLELEGVVTELQLENDGLKTRAKELERSIEEANKMPSSQAQTAQNVATQSLSVWPREMNDLTDPASSPVTIDQLQYRWAGNQLNVTFNIQYVRKDNGNQQGRILILASGPGALYAYPTDILAPSDQSVSLFETDKGEYFSVSRFRKVNAFLATSGKASVNSIEIILLSTNQKITLRQKLPVSATGGS